MSTAVRHLVEPVNGTGELRLDCLRLASASVHGTPADVLSAAVVFQRFVETGALPEPQQGDDA